MATMTPLVAFATSVSGGSLIALLVAMGLVVLWFVATARIIAQAGYSRAWILLPLSTPVLTVVCYFILWHDLNAIVFGGSFGFVGIDAVGVFWHLDQLSVLLNIGFYIAFAFSRWPGSGTRRNRDEDGPVPTQLGRAAAGPSSSPAVAPDAPRAARVMPSSGASPGSGPAVASRTPVAKRQGAQFCPWCGEATPGNRALFHDCGPKDRPETHCKSCGTALPAGSSECAACGAL